jgi:hypothetical protein
MGGGGGGGGACLHAADGARVQRVYQNTKCHKPNECGVRVTP